MGSERVTLLVDDNPQLLDCFRRGLMRLGHSVVHTATNASAALRLATRYRPAAAIVDLRIGNDWGIDLIRDLKLLDPKLRAFLLSGYVSVAATDAAMRAGAERVFFKPMRPSELMRALDEAPVSTDLRDEPPPSLARATYEHVSRVLVDAHGNVSEAARRLGIHRQTLQRHLRKIPRS